MQPPRIAAPVLRPCWAPASKCGFMNLHAPHSSWTTFRVAPCHTSLLSSSRIANVYRIPTTKRFRVDKFWCDGSVTLSSPVRTEEKVKARRVHSGLVSKVSYKWRPMGSLSTIGKGKWILTTRTLKHRYLLLVQDKQPPA